MQFKVPQFLDIEDKIFGPFTFKEFVYLAGGAGLCFVIYKLLGLLWGSIPILAVAGLSIALARYRPNNKPFINMLQASFNYVTQSKLYIWKRPGNKARETKTEDVKAAEKRGEIANTARVNGDRLRDLAWSLDVLDLNRHTEEK